MSLNIPAIARKINQIAKSRPIGKLQDIRTRLKKLKARPGDKIFSARTTFETYAFHYGGRTELQFNIGHVDGEYEDQLRYGVAFSFKLNQTLKSIDVLVPKVKFFNDFMELNADNFSDMRMWHYDHNGRSEDRPPGLIPSTLVMEGVFVFMGGRQPLGQLNYNSVLDDFDRLLPLYEYVESQGATAPVPIPKAGFRFKAGISTKVKKARASLSEKELDLDLRHNLLQEVLCQRLVSKFGRNNVRTEHPSGVGTLIDIVVKNKEGFWYYEIKTALTARACLREAIGQLLEYGLWPGAQEPTRFVVVGEGQLDDDSKELICRLRQKFSIPIEYEAITI